MNFVIILFAVTLLKVSLRLRGERNVGKNILIAVGTLSQLPLGFLKAGLQQVGVALGNLFREAGCVERLSDTAQNALCNIVTIMLGTTVGATADGQTFLSLQTIGIVVMGLAAFCFSTAGGVLLGKLLCLLTGGKINPLIGSAGVSAIIILLTNFYKTMG